VPSTTATALTPDDVVVAARRLIASDGLDAFSMRKLAGELGVNPMTIYLRFDNKDALLRAVAEQSLRGLVLPERAGSWADQVVDLTVALRDHLIADRDLLRMLDDAARLGLGLLDGVERGVTLMVEGGFDGAAAVDAFRQLFWHAVGGALVASVFPAMPGATSDLPAVFGRAERHPVTAAHAVHFGGVERDEVFLAATRSLVAGLGRAPAGEVGP